MLEVLVIFSFIYFFIFCVFKDIFVCSNKLFCELAVCCFEQSNYDKMGS